jgi:hypothetical protein
VYVNTIASWSPQTYPDQWTKVFASERLTEALLDRLTHRCHILEANGEGNVYVRLKSVQNAGHHKNNFQTKKSFKTKERRCLTIHRQIVYS